MKIQGNRFLIVGGFGLIASHIASQLIEKDANEILLFDNGSVGQATSISSLINHPKIRIIQGDVLRIENLMDACKNINGIFYTAAFITIPLSKRPVLGMDVNVKGLINTLEASRLCNVKKIIYASSIAAFGNQESGTVDEKTSYHGYGVAPVSALYGIAKLMGEQLCALYGENHGIEWMSLRLSSVYGERQHTRGVNVIPMVEAHQKVRAGLPLEFAYNPIEVHDYIYAGDVARANLLAMEKNFTGEIITIATGVPTSLETLIETVLEACGSKDKPKFISDKNRLKSAGATINSFNIGKAKLLLNWKPEISFPNGIKKLVQWLDRQK